MNSIYFIFVFLIAIVSIVLLLKIISKESYTPTNFVGLIYIISGMIIGGAAGVAIFFSIDKSKGWNPYGYWFLATFGATVMGEMIGLFVYGYRKKKD